MGLLPALILVLLTPQSELVVVKEGTREYHRAGCEVIRDGKGIIAMTRAQAESRGHEAHPACDPASQPSTPATGPEPSGSAKKKAPAAPVVHVYVDAAGKYYHRAGCRRLGKDAKKVALDEAGRKFWPCTVCRPPIRPRKR